MILSLIKLRTILINGKTISKSGGAGDSSSKTGTNSV